MFVNDLQSGIYLVRQTLEHFLTILYNVFLKQLMQLCFIPKKRIWETIYANRNIFCLLLVLKVSSCYNPNILGQTNPSFLQ